MHERTCIVRATTQELSECVVVARAVNMSHLSDYIPPSSLSLSLPLSGTQICLCFQLIHSRWWLYEHDVLENRTKNAQLKLKSVHFDHFRKETETKMVSNYLCDEYVEGNVQPFCRLLNLPIQIASHEPSDKIETKWISLCGECATALNSFNDGWQCGHTFFSFLFIPILFAFVSTFAIVWFHKFHTHTRTQWQINIDSFGQSE